MNAGTEPVSRVPGERNALIFFAKRLNGQNRAE